MKDYTLNCSEKETFILKYEIVDDQIVVYLANGKKESMLLNEKNEQKILNKMKEQVECYSYPKRQQLDKDIKLYLSCMISMGVLLFSNVINLAYGVGTLTSWICVGVCCSSMILEAISIIHNKNIKKDIEKSDFILENSKLLNEKVNDCCVLVGVNSKTLDQVKSTPDDKVVFNINTVDSMSLKDLKMIKANIENNLLFDATDHVNEKESVKVLRLKNDNNNRI